MVFDFKGFSRAHIAKRLQKSISTINHWFIDEDFKEEYRSRVLEWARDAVKDEVGTSIRTLKNIRGLWRSDPGPARLAAMNLLELAGMTEGRKDMLEGTVSSIVAHLPPNEAKRFLDELYKGYENVEDRPFRGSVIPMGNARE